MTVNAGSEKTTKPTAHRRRRTDEFVPAIPRWMKAVSAGGVLIGSRRKRPAAHMRPPIRYTAVAIYGPFIYAKSGSGKKLITFKHKWEKWDA